MSAAITGKTLLNQYRVEAYIASTPLGELHRALDERYGKYVAITVLQKSLSEDALKELEDKAASLQAITHSNIAKYIGLRKTPEFAFIIEEWIDGPSLSDVIHAAPLRINESLTLVKTIGSALDALHSKNLIHNNLVPELIRINQRGEAFISGIPNAQQIGVSDPLKISDYPPTHTSPEDISGEQLTTASDIYSLAVILYELVTKLWINGKKIPSSSKTIEDIHLNSDPPPPISLNKEIPDHVSRMILWALRKNPDDRFQTATELLSAIALAAKVSMDEIPARITPTSGPVTSGILAKWNYLPQPKATIASDTVPLQDRLATISTPKKQQKTRVGFIPIFLLLLFTGFVSLFWFVRPQETNFATPEPSTPFAANYTPPPTITPLPKPTDIHGGRIAFTCTRGDYNQLCMINRDGSGLTQLTDMDASNYYPIFSPDGGSLLFASNRNGPFDLYQLLFSEKQLFRVTKNIGNVVSPDYSPDGRRIVFVNRAGSGSASIWMVNSDGLNPKLMFTGSGDIVAVSWSPDGNRIAYAMSLGVVNEFEIYIMNIEGKDHQRISQGLKGIGGSVDWSPDGKFVLIYAGAVGDKDIFKIDAANGNYVKLTDGGNNAGASFSPDGLYVVFNSLRNDDQADLYIMRVDGSNQVQLTNDPEPDWGPQWIE